MPSFIAPCHHIVSQVSWQINIGSGLCPINIFIAYVYEAGDD
jgi:hypothetical protein